MSVADNTPDFDSMSPEELMAWMETLAERQGATEGFTTETRMEINEVDPNSVQVEDNYIPYGMNEEQWAEKKAKEDADKAARLAQRAQAKAAGTPQPAAQPPEEIQPEVLEPVAQAAPSAGGADDTPDFDSMSPEEMMKWMESLAKRQGVDSETLTTSADMNIAEIDPDSVQVEDNYIPYGMTPEEWEVRKAKESAARAAAKSALTPPPAEPAAELPSFELPGLDDEELDEETEIAAPVEPEAVSDGMDWLNSLSTEQADSGDFPQMDLSALSQEIPDLDLGTELESLDLGDLDALAGLGDLEGLAMEPEAVPASEATDPMAWLENLSESQEEFDLPTDDVESPVPDIAHPDPEALGDVITDPASDDVDPIEWLESLAKQQGADSEEFTTDADLNVPSLVDEEAGGYQDYTFEEDTPAEPEIASFIDSLDQSSDPDDPMAWLDSLASGQSGDHAPVSSFQDDDEEDFEEYDEDDEDIIERLNRAENVSPEEMGSWMANLLEQGASRTDVPDYIEDENAAEAVQAQLPDWLIDQVGQPPDLDAIDSSTISPPVPPPADVSSLFAGALEPADDGESLEDWLEPAAESAAADVEIPDWLQDSAPEEVDLPENIFADTSEDEMEIPPEPVLDSEPDQLLIDVEDPWVEAFERERMEGLQDTSTIPDWYEARLTGEPEPASAQSAPAPSGGLQPANLPAESELSPGEPEAVPAWLGATGAPAPIDVAETSAVADDVSWIQEEDQSSEMPDWLREQVAGDDESAPSDLPEWLKEADIHQTDTVPEWLLETVEDSEQPAFLPPEPAPRGPAPEPASPQPSQIVPTAASPAPVPVTNIDVAAALQSAQSKMNEGNVESSLQDYEAVVRANTSLDVVVKDLSEQVKNRHKNNAAVYRVLGDGLMRQGRLQEALDTYRKALNLL